MSKTLTIFKRELSGYFATPVAYVFIVLFLYCLLTSPLLLIVLAANAGGCYILNLKQVSKKIFSKKLFLFCKRVDANNLLDHQPIFSP